MPGLASFLRRYKCVWDATPDDLSLKKLDWEIVYTMRDPVPMNHHFSEDRL